MSLLSATFLDPRRGSVLLLDAATGKKLHTNKVETTLLPPGSAIKPFVLTALLRLGRLRAGAVLPCPIKLLIGNRRFDCTHPPIGQATVETALAYSCNCFVARAAEAFAPGELGRELQKFGFARAQRAGGDEQRMQALGESSIAVTPMEVAMAYRQLARNIDAPVMAPVMAGLEGAVEYGTGQLARVPGVKVAGKTGSAHSAAGNFLAWFAGFMPSRQPEVIVTVMLAGHSGGADAAPIAAELLTAYREHRL